MTEYTITLANLRSIGRGERIGESFADQIIASLPEGFNHNKRGAVREIVRSVMANRLGMDVDTLQSRHLASVGPKGAQRPVDANAQRGFDSVVRTVQNRLKADEGPKAPVLRVTLSGEGGGSTTVEIDSEIGRALVALIRGSAE